MDLLVDNITVRYPTKADRARAAGAFSKKPQARIICTCEGNQERIMYVPARVARSVERDVPQLPLDYARIRELVFAAEDRTCHAVLLEMLGRRDYAEGEARRKLVLAGFRDESITLALEKARASHFINNTRFAEQFITSRKLRGWGRRKIEVELKARGIDPSTLDGYPEVFFSEDDDLERAADILRRKSIPENKPFEKLVRHLMGKGFSYSVASTAVRARLDSINDI